MSSDIGEAARLVRGWASQAAGASAPRQLEAALQTLAVALMVLSGASTSAGTIVAGGCVAGGGGEEAGAVSGAEKMFMQHLNSAKAELMGAKVQLGVSGAGYRRVSACVFEQSGPLSS
jgi:hypothetical protein